MEGVDDIMDGDEGRDLMSGQDDDDLMDGGPGADGSCDVAFLLTTQPAACP